MKKHKKKKRKMYFYLPFTSRGVEKAYNEHGEGRFEIPSGMGFKKFFNELKERGGDLRARSIVIEDGQGYLELFCDQNKTEHCEQALSDYLGNTFANRIKRTGRKKNVKAFAR